MKKIILFSIFSLFLSLNFVNAQEQMTMPSDAEIMQEIQKYNFNPQQQEYLFKETKKRLQQVYAQGNAQQVINDPSMLDASQEETVIQTQKSVSRASSTSSVSNKQVQKRTKKYTSHPPLTRRSAREAQEY